MLSGQRSTPRPVASTWSARLRRIGRATKVQSEARRLLGATISRRSALHCPQELILRDHWSHAWCRPVAVCRHHTRSAHPSLMRFEPHYLG